jgi:hypothetical protein
LFIMHNVFLIPLPLLRSATFNDRNGVGEYP